MDLISSDNPVFKTYAFYAAVLVLKVFFMVVLLEIQLIKKSFAKSEVKKLKKETQDPNEGAERVRRAHRNDIENIPVFLAVGFLYLLTDPAPAVAINLFRLFTAARFLHTFVYAMFVMPQPSRFLAFAVGLGTSIYMAVTVVLHFV